MHPKPTDTPAAANNWPAFAVCVAVAIAIILDLVKVNVTLTPIEHTLGATSSQAQLIVAGYVLAFGILLVPSGRLGDLWNRKAMFVIGLITFTVASLLCALAWDATALVVARLVQGVAAGILMPQVIGLIQNLFQGRERGKAFGIFGASIGLGTAFGPTIGGLFIGIMGEELGWRWTFGMNVPIALIILPFAVWLLPGRQAHPKGVASRDLDLVGVLLMAATVLLVMLPFVLTTGTDADSPQRWWLLAAAVIVGAVFVWWERQYLVSGRNPVIDFGLFRWASYRNGVIISTLWFAVMPPMFLLMTLYTQQGLGFAAVNVGAFSIPYALISAVVAAWAGRYTFTWAARMVFYGVLIYVAMLLGMLLVGAFAPVAHTPWLFTAMLAVGGVGPGLVMSANQMRTMKHVPLAAAGVGGSFMQVGQRLGNAMGIAVATSVFYAVLAAVGMTPGGPVDAAAGGEDTYRHAYVWGMVVLVALSVVALVFSWLDYRVDARERAAGEAPG
ncbi:MFS transporter [Gulosibacter sp. GYB002]|uniref:MFS transporter n=1 Tax=Gulosibacter sp. GYB002 TaxID=2994391 RepID=UPI002F963A9B